MADELKMATTEDLLNELRTRFDHFLFMGQLDKGNKVGDSEVIHAEHGCPLMCNWMADDLKELVRHGDQFEDEA